MQNCICTIAKRICITRGGAAYSSSGTLWLTEPRHEPSRQTAGSWLTGRCSTRVRSYFIFKTRALRVQTKLTWIQTHRLAHIGTIWAVCWENCRLGGYARRIQEFEGVKTSVKRWWCSDGGNKTIAALSALPPLVHGPVTRSGQRGRGLVRGRGRGEGAVAGICLYRVKPQWNLGV